MAGITYKLVESISQKQNRLRIQGNYSLPKLRRTTVHSLKTNTTFAPALERMCEIIHQVKELTIAMTLDN
jgi:hypothetical protein